MFLVTRSFQWQNYQKGVSLLETSLSALRVFFTEYQYIALQTGYENQWNNPNSQIVSVDFGQRFLLLKLLSNKITSQLSEYFRVLALLTHFKKSKRMLSPGL